MLAVAAHSYPDASPWGAANPLADETCVSCHYDYESVEQSDALDIAGLPAAPEPGASYELIVRFAVDAPAAGFQLAASAGRFTSVPADVEAEGQAARTTATRRGSDEYAWALQWQAPPAAYWPVTLYLAASAANDDQSPFGDTIHYRRFDLTADAAPGDSE